MQVIDPDRLMSLLKAELTNRLNGEPSNRPTVPSTEEVLEHLEEIMAEYVGVLSWEERDRIGPDATGMQGVVAAWRRVLEIVQRRHANAEHRAALEVSS